MLTLNIPGGEVFDEEREMFLYLPDTTLRLEHSLISLSKWEAAHERPYLSKGPMSREEELDYIRCMTLTQNVDGGVFQRITGRNLAEINRYINAPMSATRPRKNEDKAPAREPMTAELFYAIMIELGIPFECQKWHLNRLITLIRVCQLRKTPPRKMTAEERRKLNANRKQRQNSR